MPVLTPDLVNCTVPISPRSIYAVSDNMLGEDTLTTSPVLDRPHDLSGIWHHGATIPHVVQQSQWRSRLGHLRDRNLLLRDERTRREVRAPSRHHSWKFDALHQQRLGVPRTQLRESARE